MVSYRRGRDGVFGRGHAEPADGSGCAEGIHEEMFEVGIGQTVGKVGDGVHVGGVQRE